MAFAITINGTVQDDRGPPQNVVGMTAKLMKGTSEVANTPTNGAGFYSVGGNAGAGTYRVEFVPLSPHFGAPPDTPEHEWDALGDDTFPEGTTTSAFANQNPSVQILSDQGPWEQNSGVHVVFFTMNDADVGDILTALKDSGVVFGAVLTVNNSLGKWEFDAGHVSASIGDHNFGYNNEDDWDGVGLVRGLTVEIIAENSAPTIDNPGLQIFTADTGVQEFFVTGDDVDGDSLSFSKDGGESWATIQTWDSSPPGSGKVSVQTNGVSPGDYAGHIWRVTATGGFDTASHTIRILASPPVAAWPFMSTW